MEDQILKSHELEALCCHPVKEAINMIARFGSFLERKNGKEQLNTAGEEKKSCRKNREFVR